MNIFEDEDINEMASFLAGEFYQCWGGETEEDMVQVIENLSKDDRMSKLFISAISRFLSLIDELPEIEDSMIKLGHSYDPSYDNMSQIEWLVLVKQYMKGNKKVFSSFVVPPTRPDDQT